MKRWVAYTFNEDVLKTDGVYGHNWSLFTLQESELISKALRILNKGMNSE
jgi:hypothetical protein